MGHKESKNKMIDQNPVISIITLNENGLKLKTQFEDNRLSDWVKPTTLSMLSTREIFV